MSLGHSDLRGQAPQKLKGEAWINVYKKDGVISFGFPYKTKQHALETVMSYCIDTIQISYEEN